MIHTFDWVLYRDREALDLVVTLESAGDPVSKARPRVTKSGATYTPERTRRAEAALAALVKDSYPGMSPRGDVCFGLEAVFYCATWQRRDVDNMVKLVADALTGVIWDDDSQVSEVAARTVRGVGNADARTSFRVYVTDAPMNPTAPCMVCGAPVRQYNSQPNRFCSREHAAEYQRVRVDLTCLTCSAVYQLPMARARRVKKPYCSDRCRRAQQTTTRNCEHCGRSVTRPASQMKRRTFCDVDCQRASVTHCPHGHEYTPANTYVHDGRRNCRTCRTESSRRRRAGVRVEVTAL